MRFWRVWFLMLGLILGGGVACDTVRDVYRLEADEQLSGGQHLIVVEADLQSGSVVAGNLNITASTVIINSHIEGDLTVIANEFKLGDTALIQGNLIYCIIRNGQYQQSEQAIVWGTVRNNCNEAYGQTDTLNVPTQTNPLVRLGGHVLVSLVLGLMAALASLLFPQRMQHIILTANNQRWSAVGLGGLTWVVAVGLSSLWGLSLQIVIPIVLIPLVLGAWLMLLWLLLLGSLAISQYFGLILIRLLHLNDQIPVVSAVVGASTLSFIVLFFRLIPPLSFMTIILGGGLMAWALGAALISRGGMRRYAA